MQNGFVEVPRDHFGGSGETFRLYYERYPKLPGSSKRLIFLHGGPGHTVPFQSIASKTALGASLTANYEIVYFHQRGSGKSDPGLTLEQVRAHVDYFDVRQHVEDVEAIRKAAFGDNKATLIAASVSAAYPVALASGVAAITDVHGGAGAKAAAIFSRAAARASERQQPPLEAARAVFAEHMRSGGRIEGLGHRVHSRDPRRDVLWRLAEQSGVSGESVAVSRVAGQAFEQLRGMSLPINVDGVIGAICADMGLGAEAAKAVFIYGRVAGLTAHYFEEVASQPPMRRIDFAAVEYRGAGRRGLQR